MGKSYTLPKIEEAAAVDKTDIKESAKPLAKREVKTLTDVYMNKLDEYADFAANKIGFPNIEAKQKKALEYIRLLDNLLKQDYINVRTCLRYFLKTIGKNPEPSISGSVYSVYYTMKKWPYNYKLDRYIETVTFFTSLQKDMTQASRFVSSRDLPMIFRAWGKTERDNLIMFATSYTN